MRMKPLLAPVTLAMAMLIAGVTAVCATEAQGAAQEAAVEYEWAIDLDCTLCHQTEVDSFNQRSDEAAGKSVEEDARENADPAAPTSENPPVQNYTGEEARNETPESSLDGYAVKHFESFGLTCTSCHVDSEGLAKGHKKLNSGKEATRLKKSTVTDDVCLACHDTKKLTEATAYLALLSDSRGTTVNPHDIPQVEAHQDISCTRCHAVHDADASLNTDTSSLCISCHHESVYECYTCH